MAFGDLLVFKTILVVKRKIKLILIIAMYYSLLANTIFAQENVHENNEVQENTFLGNWVVSSHILLSGFPVSNKERRHFGVRKISLGRYSATVLGYDFARPQYEFEKLNANIVIQENFDLPKIYLGIRSDSVLGIIIKGDDEHPERSLIYDGNRIFVGYDGVLYIYEKENDLHKIPKLGIGLANDVWRPSYIADKAQWLIEPQIWINNPSDKKLVYLNFIDFSASGSVYTQSKDSLLPKNIAPSIITLSENQKLSNYQFSYFTFLAKLNLIKFTNNNRDGWVNLGIQWNRSKIDLPKGYNGNPLKYRTHGIYWEVGSEFVKTDGFDIEASFEIFNQYTAVSNYSLTNFSALIYRPSITVRCLPAKNLFLKLGVTSISSGPVILSLKASYVQEINLKAIIKGASDGIYWFRRQVY